MASGNVLGTFYAQGGDLMSSMPNGVACIDKIYQNGDKRKLFKFTPSRLVDGVLPLDFVLPDTYGATTGLTFKIHWFIEGPPPDTGAVRWEIKAYPITVNSTDLSNPTYGTADLVTTTIPTVADTGRVSTITMVKAHFSSAAAGTQVRFLLTRKSATDVLDTSNCVALVNAVVILET